MDDLDSSPTMISGEALTELVMSRLRSHYAQLVPVAQAISDHCGVKLKVVGTWFVDPEANPLGGISTLALWYLLQQYGIPSPEIDGITTAQPYGSYVGKLLAYGLIDMSEAQKLCGNTPASSVLNAARGAQLLKLKQNKELVILNQVSGRVDLWAMQRRLASEYSEKLAAKVAKLDAAFQQQTSRNAGTIAAIGTVTMAAPPAASTETEPSEATPTSAMLPTERADSPSMEDVQAYIRSLLFANNQEKLNGGDPTVYELARDFVTARVSAQYALDHLDPEQRKQLKNLIGEAGYFELHQLFAALSGARARGVLQGGK